jgi:hypothetical protein
MIKHLCSGTSQSMGGVQGGMRRNRPVTCPVCGRKVCMRPGRAGRLFPHSADPKPGDPKPRGEDDD